MRITIDSQKLNILNKYNEYLKEDKITLEEHKMETYRK